MAVRELGARQIESLGILKAALRAMAQAVAALHPAPQLVLVDGNQPLPLTFPQQPVIKGDALCPSISAASIVAKVYRDSLMERLHQRYPQYNFARHKGLRHRRTPGGPALLGAGRELAPPLPSGACRTGWRQERGRGKGEYYSHAKAPRRQDIGAETSWQEAYAGWGRPTVCLSGTGFQPVGFHRLETGRERSL